MYLKSITIDGFKSFGVSSTLKFDSEISAVVGPNGSGKSNVAESFRFVLGEQSMKNMRGKKGTDLIFSGKNSRLNRASVKIIFDNTKKFLDIDYKEVVLERIVYRDGINKYFINKNQVRVKDIIELLSSANIGSTGHHIISQGEADKILSVNPKERKMIIEEALGLKSYVIKKNDAENKLTIVYDNLKEVKTNLRVIEPKIKYLKKEVDKISKSKELTLELKKLYSIYFKGKKEIKEKFEIAKKNVLDKTKEAEQKEKEIFEKKEKIKSLRLIENKKENNDEQILKLKKELSEIFDLKSKFQKEMATFQYKIDIFLQKEKEIQNLLSKGYNAKEIYNEKKYSISNILYKYWIYWAKDLIDNGEKISDQRLKKWEEYFKEYNNLTEKEKKYNEQTADEILEILNIKKPSQEVEKQNYKILDEYKEKVSEIEEKMSELSKKEQELNTEIARLNSGENIIESEIKTIQIEILKIQNIKERILSDIRFENSKIDSLQRELLTFDKEEAHLISRFGIDEAAKIMNSPIDDNDNNEERNIFEKITRIKLMLENIGTNFSNSVEDEYKELSEKKDFVLKEIKDLEESSDNLEKIIISLEQKITERFHEGMSKINKRFSEFFKTLFNGGSASLEVVKIPLKKDDEESLQEYDLGVDLKVSLPNKKVENLSVLSGGERSLVSIALLFAMSQVTPPPFIILDETDAALDEANSKRYGDMVKKLSMHSQLILITHNRETMARAGLLWGITMTQEGITKILSVSLEQAQKVAK